MQFRVPSAHQSTRHVQAPLDTRHALRRKQLAALGTSVRALGSQLHSLKAECKAYSAPRHQSLAAAQLPPTMAVFRGVGHSLPQSGTTSAAAAAWQLEEAVSEAIVSAAEVRTLLLGAPPTPISAGVRKQHNSPAASLPLPASPPPLTFPPLSPGSGAGGEAQGTAAAGSAAVTSSQLSAAALRGGPAQAPPATQLSVLPMSPRSSPQLPPAAARATAAAAAAAAVAASTAAPVGPRSAPMAATTPLTPACGENNPVRPEGGGDILPFAGRQTSEGEASNESRNLSI